MTYEQAVKEMDSGKTVARKSWDNPNDFLFKFGSIIICDGGFEYEISDNEKQADDWFITNDYKFDIKANV